MAFSAMTSSGPLKRRLFLCFLCVLPLLWLCLNNQWPRSFQGLPSANPLSNSTTVTILLWHWPFNKSLSLKGDVCWDLYRIPRCKLVDQRSFFSSADVVVFHNRELITGRQKLPVDLPRPQGQRWAWLSLEAPAHNGKLKPFSHIFNMTISYRRDADVTIPYGELLPKEADEPLIDDAPRNKSFLICWVVSNYNRYHNRSSVYKELDATVAVKVYGRWTKTPLPSEALLPTISRCYFYLAFENSRTKDYITEKLWRNAYLGRAVPVVLGPQLSDYKAVAPPNSFIHVDEFTSVRELGKYLQSLAEDKKRYTHYFNWKMKWKVKLYTDWRERLCKICPQYNRLPRHQVYSDLQAWVNANNT